MALFLESLYYILKAEFFSLIKNGNWSILFTKGN